MNLTTEQIARNICSGLGFDPDKRSANYREKRLWELYIKPAKAVMKLINGENNDQ